MSKRSIVTALLVLGTIIGAPSARAETAFAQYGPLDTWLDIPPFEPRNPDGTLQYRGGAFKRVKVVFSIELDDRDSLDKACARTPNLRDGLLQELSQRPLRGTAEGQLTDEPDLHHLLAVARRTVGDKIARQVFVSTDLTLLKGPSARFSHRMQCRLVYK